MPAEINAIVSANPPAPCSPQGFHPGFGDSPWAVPAVAILDPWSPAAEGKACGGWGGPSATAPPRLPTGIPRETALLLETLLWAERSRGAEERALW